MEINIFDVVVKVKVEFERYEIVLISNNVDVLDELFWYSFYIICYGVNENFYGFEVILVFRKVCGKVNLE